MTIAEARDQATIAELKKLGFSDDIVETPRRLIASLDGHTFTGKTHFALTAPEPILFFDVDLGTEGVVNKFQDAGKQILVYNVRVPMDKETTKDTYDTLWTDTKERIKKAYSLSAGTVVWDTESEIHELARLAHFGKLSEVKPHHYGVVNRDLRDVLDLAYDSRMSSIFIRKLKPKWVNNARTNDYEGAGWGDMEYKCQVNLTTHREDGDDGPEFSVQVKKCRQNPDMVWEILRGPMCSFEFLLARVHSK